MKSKSSTRRKTHPSRAQSKRLGRAGRGSPMRGTSRSAAEGHAVLDKQWLLQMRRVICCVSRQLDELELFFRAFDVLETKQAVRSWFNGVVPALGARPIDLCHTARGRHAVLRELGRIEHGVHS